MLPKQKVERARWPLLLFRLRSVIRDRSGSILVGFGITLPAIIGVVGLGIESGIWYVAKRALQTQADAAALSGAFERARSNPGNVANAALRDAVRNGFPNALPNTAEINNPPSSGTQTGSGGAVEVILTRPQTLLFSSMFIPQVDVRARAVAAVQVTGSACVLALDHSISGAVTNQGSVTINLAGCSVAANSASPSAIDITGNGQLIAESLWTTGNYQYAGSATLDLAKPAVVNAWDIEDPYEGVAIPAIAACNVTNASYANGSYTLNPGVYCNGLGFGTNAEVMLNPGTYYINRGDLDISATARVRCACTYPGEGVTFVLTSTGTASQIGEITINGGADVLLNAPSGSSDPFSGLIIYQDPRAESGGVNKLTGGALMNLTGAIYVPRQLVRWSGNNGPSAPACTQVIANQVIFIGNATINNTGCQAAGVQPLAIKGVRIVE